MVERLHLLCLVISRLKGVLVILLQREKDALAIPTVVVERQCHSSVVAELICSRWTYIMKKNPIWVALKNLMVRFCNSAMALLD